MLERHITNQPLVSFTDVVVWVLTLLALLRSSNIVSLKMSKEVPSEMAQLGPSSDHVERAERYVEGEDPHKAALEDNPEHAERLSLSTCAAVFVSWILVSCV